MKIGLSIMNSKLNKIMLSTVLIMIFACNRKDRFVCFMDFEQIHKNGTKIDFNQKEINPILLENRRFSETYFGTVNVWSLNREYGLKHIDPSWEESDFVKDTLELLGHKISFSDIFGSSISMKAYISKFYAFTFNTKQYLFIAIEDNSCNAGLGWCHWVLLVDISNRNNPIYTALSALEKCTCTCGNQLNLYPDYLGDFNKDGNLDYVQWGTCKRDTALLFEVRNGKLVKNPDKFLIIHNYQDTLNLNYYTRKRWNQINISKSNWFYPLQGTHKEDSCYLTIQFQDTLKKAYIDSIKHG